MASSERCGTTLCSHFFGGISRICWHSSTKPGSSYCRNLKNALIAARRWFLVVIELPFSCSSHRKKASISSLLNRNPVARTLRLDRIELFLGLVPFQMVNTQRNILITFWKKSRSTISHPAIPLFPWQGQTEHTCRPNSVHKYP